MQSHSRRCAPPRSSPQNPALLLTFKVGLEIDTIYGLKVILFLAGEINFSRLPF